MRNTDGRGIIQTSRTSSDEIRRRQGAAGDMRILGFEEIPLYIHGGRPDTFGEDAADSESVGVLHRRVRFGRMDTERDGMY